MPDQTPTHRRLPVTILSGFLGAGKTTLLNHLVRHADGERIAIIVNDIGEVNIDASLVASEIRQLDGQGSVTEVVELSGGCICCTIQGDLALAVLDMAKNDAIDHLVIESTGLAEPMQIVQTFMMPGPNGRSLHEVAQIDSLVTVIDAAFFLAEWQANQAKGPRRELLRQEDERPVFELVIEQIECADLLVLNKIDRVTPEQKQALKVILDELNHRSTKLECEQGQLPNPAILHNARFDLAATVSGASWLESLNKEDIESRPADPIPDPAPISRRFRKLDPSPSTLIQPSIAKALDPISKAKQGIVTLVYRARQPFDANRFARVINGSIPGLLRAKGYCWIAGNDDTVGFLSIAGSTSRCDFIGSWWVTALAAGKIDRSQVPPEVERKWQYPHGDRRQEIVFIGFHLDRPRLQAELDACLLPPD